VLSPSSLSTKAPIVNPSTSADAVTVKDFTLEFKETGPLPRVKEKLGF
jgi:hypothetical protein